MIDKTNQSDPQEGCKYDVGDIVIFNSFFDEGCFELLVCEITAKYDDSLEYDLEAVEEDRSFDHVHEEDMFRDRYSLRALFKDAAVYLMDKMEFPNRYDT